MMTILTDGWRQRRRRTSRTIAPLMILSVVYSPLFIPLTAGDWSVYYTVGIYPAPLAQLHSARLVAGCLLRVSYDILLFFSDRSSTSLRALHPLLTWLVSSATSQSGGDSLSILLFVLLLMREEFTTPEIDLPAPLHLGCRSLAKELRANSSPEGN